MRIIRVRILFFLQYRFESNRRHNNIRSTLTDKKISKADRLALGENRNFFYEFYSAVFLKIVRVHGYTVVCLEQLEKHELPTSEH